MYRSILAATAALGAVAAAPNPLQVTSQVMVEAKQAAPDGTVRVALAPATKVVPGDRVVLVLSYRNVGAQPLTGIVFDNPVPAGLAYRAPADGSAAPDLSVDGRTYGPLAALVTRDAAGTRPARADDVTHIRWRLTRPLMPGAAGKFAYLAVLK